MSEIPISISNLNDFIFCPVSIYFHALDEETDKVLLQDTPQLNGSAAHEKSDLAAYSTRANMLQGRTVYSDRFNLIGKIDTFDIDKGILTERKKKIKEIYDGYVFQLFGQCFALREMGYVVNQLRLYSMDDHKTYSILLPEEDDSMMQKFCSLIDEVDHFRFDSFHQDNPKKCKRCIYRPLCSFSVEGSD